MKKAACVALYSSKVIAPLDSNPREEGSGELRVARAPALGVHIEA
jgi:hypothetical protein